MLRIKFLTSIIIFSLLLIGTSIIKNKTRDIEKKIYQLNKIIHLKKNDFNGSQLDYFYLTSPAIIEKKIENLDINLYSPLEHSNIFLNMPSFSRTKKENLPIKKIKMKKIQKSKYINKNQTSFYF